MFDKVYELPINRNYVQHWGMAEGVREIIQNALDSDSPFEWEVQKAATTETYTLLIRSKNARLEPNTLLLGTTSKADNKDAIGSFGEGYKIAMLVLSRLGYTTTVYNHDMIWTPEFRQSRKFESEILCVISKNNTLHNEGVTFKIEGLSEEDVKEIKDSCLYMQKSIGAVKTTSHGLILLERPGKLFVGGLLICDTELKYGYDIKPEFISLERDRQTVANFDLKWAVKNMWFETDNPNEIAELIEEGIPDLEYAEHGSPELVKEACYELFVKRHGEGALVATSHKEMEEMVKEGLTKTVYVGGSSYSSNIKNSKSYSEASKKVQEVLSVTAELKKWLGLNKKHMRRHAIVNFQELIEKSSNWRIK